MALRFLALLALVGSGVAMPCSNGCSGHGACVVDSFGARCECVEGWNTTAGPDCSLRNCPKAVAWWDFATADDTAHAQAECSNMGMCDSATGQCTCQAGFEGVACEKMKCPVANGKVCNGRGTCMTLAQAAEYQDGIRAFTSTSYTLWDADKIKGCVCEKGYKGFDCSKLECPSGQDTVGASYTKEIQVLDCTCPDTCSGYFYIKYQGHEQKIMHHASGSDLKANLEALPGIRTVDVTLSGGSTVCDSDGVSAAITFRYDPGNKPTLEISSTAQISSNGGAVSISVKTGGASGSEGGTSVDGTAPTSECSGRGYCHDSTGTCLCQASGMGATGGTFGSSDGEGNIGSLADCGYASVSPTGCPYADGGSGTPTECATRGTCDGSTKKCNCNPGYTGNACQLKICPTGAAWFDIPESANVAHTAMECSNRGHCDRTTGTCTCEAQFTGTACEKLSCPKNADDIECSGHGNCYTISQLASLSTDNGVLRGVTYGAVATASTWDASKIQGCYCDQGYYHGPFAWDFSDYTASYDCSLLTCPYGDNPQTIGQVNEQQKVVCIGTGGEFKVTFREDSTPALPYNVDAATLQAALESLFSINDIDVTYESGATTACSSSPGTTITLDFKTTGDLPPIEFDVSGVTGGSVSITEEVRGTTEDIECSGQGTCDRTTGICSCYTAYSSSDGSGDGATVGQRGDCGAMLTYFKPAAAEESSEAE